MSLRDRTLPGEISAPGPGPESAGDLEAPSFETDGSALLVVEEMTVQRHDVVLTGHTTAELDRLIEFAGAAGVEAVLYNARNRKVYPVALTIGEGSVFEVRWHRLRVDDVYPLRTGTYSLWVRVVGTGRRFPSASDSRLTLPIDSLGIISSPRYRYWMVPITSPTSGCFQISITYRPRLRRGTKKPRQRKQRWKKSWTRRRRKTEAQVFHAINRWSRRLVRHNGKRILFTSDSRATLSGNLQVIHDRMVERGLDKQFSMSTLFKPSITMKRRFGDRFRLPYQLAAADIILCDDFHPLLYRVGFDEDVTIIQVWHASGAFKTVGHSRVGKPGGPNPFSQSHRNYTYALVSSAHDGPFYAEAFGIPLSHVVATGIPRMDSFFDEGHKAAQRAAAYEALPQLAGHRVIFFAPTFRGSGPKNARYDYEQIDFEALYAYCEQTDAMVVFKMHPFVRNPLVIPEGMHDRFVDATQYREINDLLLIADLVITDYSTVAFEFSTLGRPMLFFAYDLDEYIASRDFYVPYEEFVPGKIVRTFPELMDALYADDFESWKVGEFARTHFAHLDAGATDRVIDQLILGSDPVARCAPLAGSAPATT